MTRLTTGAPQAGLKVARSPAVFAVILAGCFSVWPLAAAAADRAPEDRQSVILSNVDLHPRDREGARALLRRLDRAAMQACGADDHSLREVKDTVRASPCWKDAMADAVGRIDDPLVSEIYRGQP